MARDDFDVAIVGLGAMGSLSAWRLAARGAKVVAFDQFRPGHDRGSSHGETRMFRTAYFESPEYVPLLLRTVELWRELEAENGSPLVTVTGGLMIGPPEGVLVKGVLESARRHGLAHRLLDAGEMKRSYPQHRLSAGDVAVLEEQAGFLRAEPAVVGAASRAEALGARLLAETEVRAVAADGNRVTIETSRGRFTARKALVAAGAWTRKLLPDLALPLTVERQVMAWLAVSDAAAFAPGRFPVFIHELPDSHLRYGFPTTDRRSVKVGGHHEGAAIDPDTIDRGVNERDLDPLRAFAMECLNGVAGHVTRASVCMYTNTPDERFIAASPSELPGVTVLSACSGHGFKFAPVMGELMADLLLEGKAPPPIIRT
jgi:sarcosine oxidase